MDLYFAYGSNLDPDDWRRFCDAGGFNPDVLRPLAPATLADEILVFDYRSQRRGCGALNIRPRPGGRVDGYLFEVTDWAALDAKEGHPHRYRRERVTVRDAAGAGLLVQTYRVVPEMRTGFVGPNSDYLTVCRAGRRHFGLCLAQLDAAAAGYPADGRSTMRRSSSN